MLRVRYMNTSRAIKRITVRHSHEGKGHLCRGDDDTSDMRTMTSAFLLTDWRCTAAQESTSCMREEQVSPMVSSAEE